MTFETGLSFLAILGVQLLYVLLLIIIVLVNSFSGLSTEEMYLSFNLLLDCNWT